MSLQRVVGFLLLKSCLMAISLSLAAFPGVLLTAKNDGLCSIDLVDAVDDCNVTVADASLYHGIALNPPVERRFRIANQVAVEVQCVVVVVGRRWEPRLDAGGKLECQLLLEYLL